MGKRTSTIVLSFFILFVLFLSKYRVVGHPVWTDSYRLLTAAHNSEVDSWSYWQHVFTKPTLGSQYRPISFFLTPFLFGQLSLNQGELAHAFFVFGFLLFGVGLLIFYQLALKFSGSQTISLLATLLLATYRPNLALFAEPSHVEKYYFPMLVLMYGIFTLVNGCLTKKFNYLVVYTGFVLALLSHEAFFIFPFCLFLINRGLKVSNSNTDKYLFALMIPSVVYLVFRLFFLKVPQSGFMEVDLNTLWTSIPGYTLLMVAPIEFVRALRGWFTDGRFWVSLFVFIGLLFSCLYELYKRRNFKAAGLFTSYLLLILPFSVLKNHFVPSREVWAFSLLLLYLLVIYKSLAGRWRGQTVALVYGVFFSGLIFSHWGASSATSQYLAQRSEKHQELREEIERQIYQADADFYEISYRPVELAERAGPYRGIDAYHWFYSNHFAGFLAFHFSDKKFILNYEPQKQRSLVLGRTYYNQYSGSRWLDPFRYKARIDLGGGRLIRKRILLPPSLIETTF